MNEPERPSRAELLPILSLHRYWIWADFHKESMRGQRQRLEAAQGAERAAIEFDGIIALSFLYASLFVVVEGWRELRLADDEIDAYLASENTDLLRRFRNGVFHFQRDFDDPRFMEFLDEADDPVEWARSLHAAFARWFDGWGRRTLGYGPRDIAQWMQAERDAATEAAAAAANRSAWRRALVWLRGAVIRR
jgi:hypothetical protein